MPRSTDGCAIHGGIGFSGFHTHSTVSAEPATFHLDAGNITAISRGASAEPCDHGGAGCIVMPGLVNAHHHTGLTPLQHGIGFCPLETWLPQFIGMRTVDPYLDTLYSACEMARCGVTTVQHIHGGLFGEPAGWRNQTKRILEAYEDVGLRVSYSFMIRDRCRLTLDEDEVFLKNLPEGLRGQVARLLCERPADWAHQLEYFDELAEMYNRPGSLVRVQLAPANLHWCTDACLKAIVRAAERTGSCIHMHLLETSPQREFARKRCGRSAVEHIADLGLLGPMTTLGHANWVTENDLDLIAASGTRICHNPSSGLRLTSGIAPVREMRQRAIPVAIGIDQSGINDDHDMLQELRMAWALQNAPQRRPLPATEILEMATRQGARTTPFAEETGELEPGRAADLVILDRDTIAGPWMDERTRWCDALLHRAKREAITNVFVAGREIVGQGRVKTVDEASVWRDIGKALSSPLSDTEASRRALVQELMPFVERSLDAWTPHLEGKGYQTFNNR